jgi:SAM-dependent methyltransferase
MMADPIRFFLVGLALLVAPGCARKEAPATSVDDGHKGDPASAAPPPANATAEAVSETPEQPEQPEEPKVEGPRKPDVVYVPTPQPIVDKMLALAKIKKTDLLYDLGCGDGRIVVTAAKKYGVKAVGYDIDPQRVAEARENVKKNGVEDLVTIENKDIFKLDLSPANVVTLYLLPELNVKLIPQLEKLAPGARIVSHDFDMAGVEPDKKLKLQPAGVPEEHSIYLFSVPLKKVKK